MKSTLSKLIYTFLIFFVLFSCTETEPEQPLGEYDQGILIMNEGSFGSNDGDVYHLDPTTEELKPNIFEDANLRPFAGLLEDIVFEDGRIYLVANTGKVEIVDPGDFTSIGSVTSDLDISRSLTVNSGKLFISDYGPYDSDFNTPESYIAVVGDELGGSVTTKIPVSRKPEDLISVGKFVLVAGSEEGQVEVIDAETEEITETITVEGSPAVFFEADGQIFLYSVAAEQVIFYSIRPTDFSIASTDRFPIENATGKIAFGNNEIMYLLTSSGFPDYEDAIARVSLSNTTLEPNWYSGSGFYGIGFDQQRGEVYVANSNAFQGNGTITVLDESGDEIRSFDVGRGPSGFLMR